MFDEAVVNRLTELDLGDAALVFGRIDRHAESPDAVESFHIGRLAVADENSEPVVVDWRAPVAEPFYRATGRDPMGLARRRHFAVEGRKLLGIEDELFGEGHLGVGRRRDETLRPANGASAGAPGCAATARCSPRSSVAAPVSSATSSPPSRPSRTRSSAARRPACSSCRAVRAPARRSSPCTAPPTCCTRTASRSRTRACWSSARTACSCATSSGCCRRSARPASSRWCSPTSSPTSTGRATASTRPTRRWRPRTKGDLRMALVIDKAVTDRERPLREDVVVAVPHRLPAAARRRDRSASCAPRSAASVATTRPAAGSRARCGRRWPPRWRERRAHAARGPRRRAPAARDARRARADVAGAHARPSCCTTCSASKALLQAGRGEAPRRGRVPVAVPAARATTSHDVRWTRQRRRPARRGPQLPRARPTRSPTARPAEERRRDPHVRPHRRSTRCRTSRRCSCAWRRAAR